MIQSLTSYQDYINLFFFYFDPNVTHMDKEHQFSFDKDTVKLLPYFSINQNGSFIDTLEESYFTNNAFSNVMILDMIQNPFIDNIVQSNLFDHHLLYMVNSYEDNNSYLKNRKNLEYKFFNQFNYQSVFSPSQSVYYKAYSTQAEADKINDTFSSGLQQYLILFKRAFNHIPNMSIFEQQLDNHLSKIFNSFSSLLQNNIDYNIYLNLSKEILKGFNTNRKFLNKLFDDLEVVNSPLFEKLHEGYHIVQTYNDNQISNLEEAKKRLSSYPENYDVFFNNFTLFLEIGASLISKSEQLLGKNLFSESEKQFTVNFFEESKFLLYQSDFHCLKTFVELLTPVIPDSIELNERKKEFVNKYSQSISNIEKLYNKYDISLFNNKNYLDIISLKEILPTILLEIDNILISSEDFYSFKLDEPALTQFKDIFKNNLFISLCQNKVNPDIYHNLHLNYQAINREINLTKKLSNKNTITKSRNKI